MAYLMNKRLSKANASVFNILTFLKSLCAGLSRKLNSPCTTADGTCTTYLSEDTWVSAAASATTAGALPRLTQYFSRANAR